MWRNYLFPVILLFHLIVSVPSWTLSKSEGSDVILQPSYAVNIGNAVRLAITEEKIVDIIFAQVRNGGNLSTDCSIQLKTYLVQYHRDKKLWSEKKGRNRASHIVSNPILVFKMIQRLVVTLLTEAVEACGVAVEKPVNATFQEARLTRPSRLDLFEASTGILRIQYVYGLNATRELYLGIINGVSTGSRLYYDDCTALAEQALKFKLFHLTAQWLIAASLSGPIPMPTKEYEPLFDQVWRHLHQDAGMQDLQFKKQLDWPGAPSFQDYRACRGEMNASSDNLKAMSCYYDRSRHPYFIINPLKCQVLSRFPPIYQFYDVLHDREIKAIRNAPEGKLSRSGMLTAQGESVYGMYRTSINGWIKYSDLRYPQLKRLTRFTEMITGLSVGEASQFQVAQYGSLGGHYGIHIDSMLISPALLHAGDRIATFMTYLNDVPLGGYTGFPEVGVFAQPVKGSALFWYNLNPDGTPNLLTRHCGCPVMMGKKEIATRWIMEYPNAWKYQLKRINMTYV